MTSGAYDYFSLPLGYKFNPTDEELICHYLRGKINGTVLESQAVVDMMVYEHEPWLIQWEDNAYMKPDERYYFVQRHKACTNSKAKRPKRTLDGGFWKATSGDKKIYKEGNLEGYMKALTFYRYINENKDRKEAVNSNWVMHEYRLATDKFQEWVLCRIKKGQMDIKTDKDKDKGKGKEKEEEKEEEEEN